MMVKSNGEKVGTHCSLNQSSGPGARLRGNELYTSDIMKLHILSKASEETRASLQHSSSTCCPLFGNWVPEVIHTRQHPEINELIREANSLPVGFLVGGVSPFQP
jgi:hypothetical protein